MGEYHAGTAALCILAGGIPGFRIELLLLLSPNVALWCVFVRLFCGLFWALLLAQVTSVQWRRCA